MIIRQINITTFENHILHFSNISKSNFIKITMGKKIYKFTKLQMGK